MSELERKLTALGAELEWPETPAFSLTDPPIGFSSPPPPEVRASKPSDPLAEEGHGSIRAPKDGGSE